MISFRCPEHGPIDCVLVDGYSVADRLLEGVVFEVYMTNDRRPIVQVTPFCAGFFQQFHEAHWLEQIRKYVQKHDLAQCSVAGCRHDVALQPWDEILF